MKISLFILLFLISHLGYSQLVLTSSSTANTKCNGSDCVFTGSPVIINEVMLSPSSNDGSLFGEGLGFAPGACEGEWIELFNPDLCNPYDISCFFFGNNTYDNPFDYFQNYSGGYIIPNGTIIPPGGFAVIRGINAQHVASNLLVQNGGKTIEITVSSSRVCVGGGARFWLPNAGGWLALYDRNGVPMDAISWNNVSNTCTSCEPCLSSGNGCSFSGPFTPYDLIPANKKKYIPYIDLSLYLGMSFRRIPDGGIWEEYPNYHTQGNCNQSPCNQPQTPCDGTATIVTTGGNPPYTYLWNDIRAQNTATAIELCTGLYCVTVTDANHITATKCINVYDFKPIVSLVDFSPVCQNASSFTLTGGTPIDHLPNDAGTYSGNGVIYGKFYPFQAGAGISEIVYTYINEDGCFNSDTSSILVNPNPTPAISGALSICSGHSAILDAGAGYVNYFWSSGEQSQTITTPNAGIYAVTVVDVNGCSANTHANVTNNSPPPVITGNLTFCSGDSSILDAGTGYLNYQWQPNGESSQTITVTQTGNYDVIVTLQNGCTSTSTIGVTVNPTPDANFVSDKIYGCEPLSVYFTPMNPQPDYIYSWNFYNEQSSAVSSEMQPVYTFQNEGIYNVSLNVATINGCFAFVDYQNMISVFPMPTASFTSSPEYPSLANPEVYFYNSSLLADHSNWSFGDGGYSGQVNPSHAYSTVGEYNVMLIVTTYKGCVDTAIKIVKVEELTFYAPNAFSPDNAIANNVFYVTGIGIKPEEFHLYIYDRWGMVIFETEKFKPDNPAEYGWNGKTFNGNIVQIGSYTWFVSYLDNQNSRNVRTGVVNVIR